MLTHAAILLNGKIYIGKRHYHCISQISREVAFGAAKKGTQGFIDEDGKFYTRAEGKQHVLKCKQPYIPLSSVLTSEDLW